MSDPRLHAPATLRNRDPILTVLQRVLPPRGLVLEISSGSGEHAAYMAPRLAPRIWQPSDIDPGARASIAAYVADTAAPNLLPPVDLDVTWEKWPVAEAAAIVCVNMIHIAPWQACLGLLAGAGRILTPGTGVLYLYGPFMRGGSHTAPTNAAFDSSLRSQNPDWGIRDLDAVSDAAAEYGLEAIETVEMPANNLSVIYRKNESPA